MLYYKDADGLLEGPTADKCEKGGRPMSATIAILLIDGHDEDRQFYAHSLRVSSPDYKIFEAVDGPRPPPA